MKKVGTRLVMGENDPPPKDRIAARTMSDKHIGRSVFSLFIGGGKSPPLTKDPLLLHEIPPRPFSANTS